MNEKVKKVNNRIRRDGKCETNLNKRRADSIQNSDDYFDMDESKQYISIQIRIQVQIRNSHKR